MDLSVHLHCRRIFLALHRRCLYTAHLYQEHYMSQSKKCLYKFGILKEMCVLFGNEKKDGMQGFSITCMQYLIHIKYDIHGKCIQRDVSATWVAYTIETVGCCSRLQHRDAIKAVQIV